MGDNMKFSTSRILPQYPRTYHLPYKPNTQRGDLLADDKDTLVIFQSENTYVEEKIDGANCGMALYEGNPIIRNHNHILKKGFDKATPAKKQFSSVWNWFYKNKDKFQKLNEIAGEVSVYGEWMVAVHGMQYDYIPEWFMPYDLYDYRVEKFLDPEKAREFLHSAGFTTVPIVARSPILGYEDLEKLCHEKSVFSTNQPREGIYVKISDGKHITHRFKMVREGFIQGGLWSNKAITKNKLAEETDKVNASLTNEHFLFES